jgi:hypothetical protein
MICGVFLGLAALLAGYVARWAAARWLARALDRAVRPLDATMTFEALFPGEASAADLLATLAVVRYRLTEAGARPYVGPTRAALLRGREEEPPELRERREARRALVRDPLFCGLAQVRDRLDISKASPQSPEEALSLGVSGAMDALVIAVYRVRYQGSGAICALRQVVERFRGSLEGRGTGSKPRTVAKARGKAATPPRDRLRLAREVRWLRARHRGERQRRSFGRVH